MEIIINQSHRFELILTDNQGNFVTGQTVTFEVRNSITDALITSGTLSETNEVYHFDFTFTTLAQFRVKYFTPMNFPNAIESVEIVNSIPDQVWDEPLSGHLDSGTTGEALDDAGMVSDPGAIADAVWLSNESGVGRQLTEGTKDSEIDDIKAKTDNLPSDPSSETNATSNTNSILTAITGIASDVWSFTTRTLTSFGTLISDIWSFVTRTLTGIGTSGIASEANATINTNSIIAEIDANEVKIDAIGTDITAHRNAVETKILNILGLTQQNTQIKDFVYDGSGNAISGTIRLYPTANDAENDTNHFQEYAMTAEYDTGGKLTKYIVSEV